MKPGYLLAAAFAALYSGCGIAPGPSLLDRNVGPAGPPCANGQAASVVVGQADLVSGGANRGGSATAATLNLPAGISYDVSAGLVVADQHNNRVLTYDPAPTSSGAGASFVVGQPDFAATGTATSAAGLNSPTSARANGVDLWVADTGNSRVVYHLVPESNGPAALFAIGASDLITHGGGGCGPASFVPGDIAFAFNKLLLTAAARALVFSPAPISSGRSASYAIGDTATTCASPIFAGAQGIWSDGTRVAIADTDHHRVLIWNSLPTTDTLTPDLVLGQPDLATVTANSGGISASSLKSPVSFGAQSSHFYVVDSGNNRVLIWNSFPVANQQPADVVLGQTSFTAGTAATSATGLSSPHGVATDELRIFVSDTGNSRVLAYDCQ